MDRPSRAPREDAVSTYTDPRPVQRCRCGRECDWCVASNKARAAFPRATVPPKHDAAGPDDHSCAECFMLEAERLQVERLRKETP